VQVELDRGDLRILDQVQEHGDLSAAEIAERLGMTASTCWRRMSRLQELESSANGWHSSTAEKVGLKRYGFSTRETGWHDAMRCLRFEQAVREHPEVLECYTLMGETDFLLRIVCRDIKAYEAFFLDHLSRFPGCSPSTPRSRSPSSRRRPRCLLLRRSRGLRHRCSLIGSRPTAPARWRSALPNPAPRDRGTAPRATLTNRLQLISRPLSLHGQHARAPPAQRRYLLQHLRNGANARATSVEGYARLQCLDARVNASTLTNPSTWAACETKRIFLPFESIRVKRRS